MIIFHFSESPKVLILLGILGRVLCGLVWQYQLWKGKAT